MRAAIYARVSSAAQRDSHTIENQLRILPAFVASQGWTLAGTYTDDGRSAKAGKLEARDGFARLVADAEAGRFDVLVVVAIDRLTRTDSIEERATILGPFQRKGIDIVTPSGGRLDMRTMLGELYVTMQALVAAEENRIKGERIKAGKARAIAEGRKPSGPTPFGLAYDRASAKTAPAHGWSLDPVRADIVREIFRRIIGGEACQAIADDLFDRGAPSPRGPWHPHKVWAIARSKHVYGEWVADKSTRATVAVPAIIDEATYLAAQARLLEHGKRGLRRTRHVYLLEGLAKCGACGQPISIRSPMQARRGLMNPPAYVCRGRKLKQRGVRCTAPILKVADVDARVWAVVERALVSDDLAARVAAKFEARAANRRDWSADAKRYEARLEKLTKTEASLLARFRAGSVSEGALDLELAAIGRERSALRVQLDTARAASVDVVPQVSATDYVATLRALAAETSPEARQRIVRAIVEHGAIFDGHDVRLTLLIDAPTEARAPIGLALASGSRTQNEDIVRLRVVASGGRAR